VIDEHFGTIDRMASRLRQEPYGSGAEETTPLLQKLPGLLQLFNSVASPSWTTRSPEHRAIEEWNPISQRVLLPDEAPPPMGALESDFNLLRAHAQTFVEWSHEAVHVLSLEPVFVGAMPLGDADRMTTLLMGSEALAFWYADMVVTPAIRRTIPKAELVYGRSAVSNLTFHPEEVFRRLGIRGRSAILLGYIQTFIGEDGAIGSGNDPFGLHLRRSLRELYDQTRGPVHHLHALYERLGLPEYLKRFCLPGLPSLLSRRELERAATLSMEAYLTELGTRWLPALADLKPEEVKAVCLRRHAQTRAYYAWSLQALLRKGWVATGVDGQPTTVSPALDVYLAALEFALCQLHDGATHEQVEASMRAADDAFEKDVREPLLSMRAFVTRRAHLHPFFAPTEGVIGLPSDDLVLSRGQMVAIIKHLTDKFDWGPAFTVDGDHETVALLYSFLTIAKKCGLDDVCEQFDHLMRRPDVIPFWSVYLAALSPTRNVFRELAFAFA
jgi:hypothetical protein